MRMIAAAALAAALLGCSGSMTMTTRSPGYEAGFAEGCANAAAQGPGILRVPRRNEMLYASDPDYRRGWNSGNVQCRAQGPNRL